MQGTDVDKIVGQAAQRKQTRKESCMSTSQTKAGENHGIAGLAFLEAEYAVVYSRVQAEGKADKLHPDTRAALEIALTYLEQFWRPAKLECLICQRDISGPGDRTRVPFGEIVVVVPFDLTAGARLFGGLCADCTLKPKVDKETEAWAAIGRLTGTQCTRIEPGRA
jgi:hypothetical protein